jgi:hypothetical protein
MMREVSMEEAVGEGKGERSRRVMVVREKEGRRERERAVERPKTPEPMMRIEEGGVKEGVEEEGDMLMGWRRWECESFEVMVCLRERVEGAEEEEKAEDRNL